MTNIRLCFAGMGLTLMLAAISHAQTCSSGISYSSPVVSTQVGAPYVTGSTVISSPLVSNYPQYSITPSVSSAPVVTNWSGAYSSGYSYTPAQTQYYAPTPQFLTNQGITRFNQGGTFRNDRLERAYTGETIRQQDQRQFKEADYRFNQWNHQTFPNSPLLRFGANVFLSPQSPEQRERARRRAQLRRLQDN